ncbi:AfsR/SARP family transcriptional regulator [Kribbella deserti]|uniref:BTAD domain-containing putative transcriptional regulator n=1 Tax=Kribbella deserti TaxID=1926257 RepID=A0ABV6QH36_9ACTN
MRYGVLGPVEVLAAGGARVALGAKQRAILAALLCQPNQAISTGQLIDLAWPRRPPAAVRNSLQVQVYRLRKSLGDERIRHTAAGYTLVVQPDELDARRFEDDAEAGRRAAGAGSIEQATGLWRRALNLWRGEPFAGLEDLALVREEAARLEELRVCVWEEQMDAGLQVGRHHELVPELTRLCASFPLRERFRAQLMLALYRSGRQADALAAYRDGRELIRTECGLEPGHDLQRLETDILRADRALDLVPDRVEVSKDVVPAELPAPSSHFVGREAETALISDLLRRTTDGPVMTAISGVGGVGKSALAVQVANTVAEAFPDGQLYVNLLGATPGVQPLPPEEALDRLLRALGDTADRPAGLAEATARFRTLTAHRKLLLVLDDAIDVTQLRPLVPGGSGCGVLITSRVELPTLDGVTQVRLDVLGDNDGLRLLTALAGSDRVAGAETAALDIVRLCGRLPLAIRIAGARLATRRHWTPRVFAERLSRAHVRLDELEYADLAVRASFTMSLEQLRADRRRVVREAAAVFPLLGLLELPTLTAPVVSALAGLPNDKVADHLDLLVEAQLLRAVDQHHFVMHDLVRLYARELAAQELSESERSAAIQRAMEHYLATSRTALMRAVIDGGSRLLAGLPPDEVTQAGLPLTDKAAALDWLRREDLNLLATIRQASVAPGNGPAIALGLAAAMNGLGVLYQRWPLLLGVNRLALRVADAVGSPREVALAAGDLGRACRLTGRPDEAEHYFQQALRGWQAMADLGHEASVLYSLGALRASAGDLTGALRYHQRALALRRASKDVYGEAHLLHAVGLVEMEQGQFGDALRNFTRSHLLFRRLAIGEDQGMVLTSVGRLHVRRGDSHQALAVFERALALLREAGDRATEAFCLWHLAKARQDLALSGRAEQQAALSLLAELRVLSADEVRDLVQRLTPSVSWPLGNH